MANVNVNSGINDSLEPVVNIMVQDAPDSTSHVLTFGAQGAINLSVDIMTAAAKAQITAKIYKRLRENLDISTAELEKLLEGIGD